MAGRDPVVVCGAGAAGMAAALAAARVGANVLLVEAASQTGGTVANVLIHTIGGLFDTAGRLINAGLAQELTERLSRADPHVRPRRLGKTWVLNVCPDDYRAVTRRWLGEYPGITVLLGARVTELGIADSRIDSVRISGPQVDVHWHCQAVIDCTGTAEIVRLVDPELVHDEPGRAAGGLIVRLKGVAEGALEFPRGVGLVRALRVAAAEGKLPRELGHAWVDSGVRPDEAYLKLMVPLPDARCDVSADDSVKRAGQQAAAAHGFLRSWPGFEKAEVARVGEVGVRDGGRVRGEYCLTAADVSEARKFADAVCRCAWPIEFWDPQCGVKLHYLPDNDFYEIPLRCLKVGGIANLWAAGKCLSADRQAQASARIAGTCWAMGEAVGRAAVELTTKAPRQADKVTR